MSGRLAVRFSRLRRVGLARCAAELGPGQACVVQLAAGELPGRVLWRLGDEGPATLEARAPSADDAAALAQSEAREAEARALLEKLLVATGRPLEVVALESYLAGGALSIYYRCDGLADWRELDRRLREQRPGRISWQQVGAREKAKICGGVGSCGRELCCSTVLRELEPVTMRGARIQGGSASPEDTAGACGRLKCCLRYETDAGSAIGPEPLALGASVQGPRMQGRLVALDELRRTALVEDEGGRRWELFLRELSPIRKMP